MKTNLLTTVGCTVMIAGLACGSAAAQDELPTLIVPPFSGDIGQIPTWQPALGAGLAEMLITELGKLNKFTVLETTQLEALQNEIRMGEDGWVEPSEKVEKGGFAGADFMFTAKVTRFGHKESKVNLGGFVPGNLGKLGVKQSNSDVRLDWRLVDASSRKVIKTGSATAAEKGTGFDVGVNVTGHGGGVGFDNKEFMESALGKATVKALAAITSEMKGLNVPASARSKQKASLAGQQASAAAAATSALRNTPGKVLAVAGKGVLIVSLGSKQGFKTGDKLTLFETVDTKDDQGNVVFSEEKPAGEITLDAVQEERSKASYAGDQAVKAGWVVRAK